MYCADIDGRIEIKTMNFYELKKKSNIVFICTRKPEIFISIMSVFVLVMHNIKNTSKINKFRILPGFFS